jgi:microcystin-dependent protein
MSTQTQIEGFQIVPGTIGTAQCDHTQIAFQSDLSGLNGAPTGGIVMFAGTTAPTGWVLCDGSSYNGTNATYTPLWNIIGNTYGGSGQSSFKVPDLRSRLPVGAGQGSGLTNRTLASVGGNETHTLSTSEMPSHSHTLTDPGHQHTIPPGGEGAIGSGNSYIMVQGNNTYNLFTNSATTGITLGNTGGGGSFGIMNPFLVLNYLIKL